MSAQATHQQRDGKIVVQIPSHEDVYNSIMGAIEPDLLLDNIKRLDEQYQQESGTERTARLERYRQAYAEYDKQFKTWLGDFVLKITAARRDALRLAESKDAVADTDEMTALEALMDQAASTDDLQSQVLSE